MIIQKKYTTVTNRGQYHDLIDHINKSPYIAFDTETTGLSPRKDKIIGFSICGKIGESFYIPTYKWEMNNLVPVELEFNPIDIIKLLSTKDLIMHNGSFDCRMVKSNYKIDLLPSLVCDTMLIKHTVDEEHPFALKDIAKKIQDKIGLDVEKEANEEQLELKESIKRNGGSSTKTNYELYKADMHIIAKYGASDTDLTLRVFEYYYDLLEKEKLEEFLFDKEVMPLYKEVTVLMEEKGIALDLELIKQSREMIIKDIDEMEAIVQKEILEFASDFEEEIAKEKYAISNKGNFAQKLISVFLLDLPKVKSGKFSLTGKNLQMLLLTNLTEKQKQVVNFLLEGGSVPVGLLLDFKKIQKELCFEATGRNYFINISSKDHLIKIFYDILKEKPIGKTTSGKDQMNDSFLELMSEKYHFARVLSDYNKLCKIKSAYMDRFLDKHENGRYYFYYKQHGTISGRYGSDAQQLPRPKEDGELSPLVLKYNNLVRSFFIAGKDRKFIDADFESLEPHVFAHVSNDDGLRDIFRKGHDFYSTIAIDTEGLEEVSADKKADNYLGKINKPIRQKAKAYSLGIPYGLTPYALAKTLEVDEEEAKMLYEGYLNAYPNLKKWMESSKRQAQYKGYVTTETGRVRHLPKVKEIYNKHRDKLLNWQYRLKMQKQYGKDVVNLAYKDYKNGVNNSRNFQIQGLSASIVNRAAIAINKRFKELSIDAWVCMQVHDQIVCEVPENRAEECAKIVQELMENTTKISLELKAPASISDNLKEGH